MSNIEPIRPRVGTWPPCPPASVPVPCPPPRPVPPDCFSWLAKQEACYNSVQQMEKFLAEVMKNLIANDPSITQAIIDQIVATGAALPLIGVTNGEPAQPGQVGEFVLMDATTSIPVAQTTQSVTLGVLQPGDWDVWLDNTFAGADIHDAQCSLVPQPAGFTTSLPTVFATSTGWEAMISSTCQALISVPTLIAFQITSNAGGAGSGVGTLNMHFMARRMR